MGFERRGELVRRGLTFTYLCYIDGVFLGEDRCRNCGTGLFLDTKEKGHLLRCPFLIKNDNTANPSGTNVMGIKPQGAQACLHFPGA